MEVPDQVLSTLVSIRVPDSVWDATLKQVFSDLCDPEVSSNADSGAGRTKQAPTDRRLYCAFSIFAALAAQHALTADAASEILGKAGLATALVARFAEHYDSARTTLVNQLASITASGTYSYPSRLALASPVASLRCKLDGTLQLAGSEVRYRRVRPLAHLVDVDWRLDYTLKDARREQIDEANVLVELVGVRPGESPERTRVLCSPEQLQSLTLRMKEALRALESLASTSTRPTQ